MGTIVVVIIIAMVITPFMSVLADRMLTPENEETFEHNIEQLEYTQKTIEKGIFTTKSHNREYVEVIYTDGETGQKDTELFRKEFIKIGDNTKLLSEPSISDVRIETLYLTEDEFINFFFENPQNIDAEEYNNMEIKETPDESDD